MCGDIQKSTDNNTRCFGCARIVRLALPVVSTHLHMLKCRFFDTFNVFYGWRYFYALNYDLEETSRQWMHECATHVWGDSMTLDVSHYFSKMLWFINCWDQVVVTCQSACNTQNTKLSEIFVHWF